MAPFHGMVLLLLGIGYLLHAEPTFGHRDIGIIVDDVRSSHKDDHEYSPIVAHFYEEHLDEKMYKKFRMKRHTYFYDDLPQNVTVAVGQSAVLSCRVENLENRTVSWMRKKDVRILTSMKTTYTADKRFVIIGKSPNWDLQIDSVQPDDAGIYECQVNTEPKMDRTVNLKVLDVQAKILGSEEVYVKKGSKISLTCTVDMQDVPPSNVTWYHAGSVIDFDSPRGGVSLETEKGKSFTKSMLVITRALLNDSGNYTCFSNKAAPASVVVHVLNGERYYIGASLSFLTISLDKCVSIFVASGVEGSYAVANISWAL
ncbi:PREDICTED: immunoglobulin superfamily DCC subclass member 4-like isoform X1 [Polistes dominula]|uniref:Immunoglobulin superfamily DCC subclass member 4-like isoform X1 n=1 Tax=Polistes dominula TaxID=743375 RepID=A0ABM1IT45_POLDO|nr:PREDICTED: immunoglobulin superfamily DCC subclass member 4-like isoform X1 [Polistes dominula]